MRTLATVATIDPVTGVETVVEYENPAPLKATLLARRRGPVVNFPAVSPDRTVIGQPKPS
ncbi:hypothetical protein MSIMFB_03140 [Mycobacterium simulans]|uniref:Uncharacterized protein n=1 Tax=Mycobacterium simulans TaxID=627089 RepID=A0A7Z7INK4_9MYCO|nr:hypothetical protein MSIMFB_03140 [Mycobacterium simulans]